MSSRPVLPLGDLPLATHKPFGSPRDLPDSTEVQSLSTVPTVFSPESRQKRTTDSESRYDGARTLPSGPRPSLTKTLRHQSRTRSESTIGTPKRSEHDSCPSFTSPSHSPPYFPGVSGSVPVGHTTPVLSVLSRHPWTE